MFTYSFVKMEHELREDNSIGATNRSNVIGLENIPQDNAASPSHVVTLFPSKLERQYSEDMKHSGRNGFLDIIRQLIITALLLAIFCGFLFESKVNYDRKSAFLFRQGLCDKTHRFSSKYAIVFDAGSTGSRVHVYEFQFCGDKLLNLLDEIFEQTKPGLSAYPEDPEEAVESLVPLLRKAWRRVPRSLRRCTPIVVKATAGLRLLPAEKVRNILDSVKDWLDDQPFHFPRSASGFKSEPVSVIDGSEEAVSAWISVNFLQGHIGPERKASEKASPNPDLSATSVVLEMGGGSAQIVFNQKDTTSSQLPNQIIDLKFFGRVFNLYQHSFLGYGLMEARKTVKKFVVDSKAASFNCYPKGYEEMFMESKIVGNSDGFSSCRDIIKRSLFSKIGNQTVCAKAPCSINGVHQPNIPESSPIYALSYINDRAVDLKLDGTSGYTLNELKKRSEVICSSSFTDETLYDRNPAICLDLAYIYTLLHDGYGIPENRKIHSGQTIKDYETGWTLGSALSVIESAPTFCK